MTTAFVGIALFATLAARYGLTTHRIVRIDERELGYLAALALGLVTLSALPLLWLDQWSLESHAISLSGLTALPALRLLWRWKDLSFQNGLTRWSVSLILAFALGVFLQGKSVYNLSMTHDSALYLNASRHLVRTGSFFYTQLPETMTDWAPIEKGEKPWSHISHYGLWPTEQPGVYSFHGFFATPVFLAIGHHIFGRDSEIAIQRVFFAASLLLLAAILVQLLGRSNIWSAFALCLYACLPLVSSLYRESLSEPLTQVFFLFLVSLFLKNQYRREPGGAYLILIALFASLCTRASGFFYLPFVFLPLVVSKELPRIFWVWAALGLAYVASSLAVSSPAYMTLLPKDLFQKLFGPQEIAYDRWVAPVLVVSLVVALLLREQLRTALQWAHENWSRVSLFVFSVLLAGVVYRYGKTLIYFGLPIEGFPFVRFNFDGLLFYLTPFVALLGIVYWVQEIRLKGVLLRPFLSLFAPFCFGFYVIYYFGNFQTQPYMYRYFLTELTPLLIAGAVILMSRLSFPWQRAVPTVTLAWAIVVSLAITHPKNSEGMSEGLEALAAQLTEAGYPPHRTVLLSSTDNWMEDAYLASLGPQFGYAFAYAKAPFSEAQKRTIAELQIQGFRTLAVNNGGKGFPVSYCYGHPGHRTAAPPFELQEVCLDVTLKPIPKSDVKSLG